MFENMLKNDGVLTFLTLFQQQLSQESCSERFSRNEESMRSLAARARSQLAACARRSRLALAARARCTLAACARCSRSLPALAARGSRSLLALAARARCLRWRLALAARARQTLKPRSQRHERKTSPFSFFSPLVVCRSRLSRTDEQKITKNDVSLKHFADFV